MRKLKIQVLLPLMSGSSPVHSVSHYCDVS